MPTLIGLKGMAAREIAAEFIKDEDQIEPILSSGKAVTAAGDRGAFNIWIDDEGEIRCDAMRFCVSVSTLQTRDLKLVKAWAKQWLRRIE